ncbi:hypothetical protein, partial [Paractinoplanes durhamensis]|uniref:hypothetical protein n=1 Tax=Paractinoplanes durhamensis TaxID=113563 RepID=UPI0031D9C6C9
PAAAAAAAAGGVWPYAAGVAALVAASVLAQAIAQLVGTACGLLFRRRVVAMAATIVVPMAVTVLLGAIDPGGGLGRWLTPYGNAQAMFTGTPSAIGFAASTVVVLLWCVAPNVLGARISRARAEDPARERRSAGHGLA